MLRGLTGRVLAVAMVSALVTMPMVLVPIAQWVSQSAIRNTFHLASGVPETLAGQCRRDPARWSVERPESSIYAYDGQRRVSANPAAPLLDADLMQELDRGVKIPSRLRWTLPFGGMLLVPTGSPGPCSLLSVHWRPPVSTHDLHRKLFIAITVGSIFVAGVGSILFAIVPLLRRIAALDRAAENIGDADRFEAVEDPTDDALGRLATRISDSHGRIVAANRALEQRAQALQNHLADVAHYVRTPLAALQLRLEQLANIGSDKDTAGQGAQTAENRQQLIASLEDVLYLTSLTENLRLASRLKEAAIADDHAMQIDLRAIVRRVVNRFSVLGAMRGIRVRESWPEEAVTVRCDPSAAEQAVTNLVQNAVVYGRNGGSVTVVLDRVDAGFEMAVIDDGPGVSPDMLPRLVERRFRSDEARSRGPSGSGLGLAIVAEVCARWDWTLEFMPQEPHGLQVVIRGRRVPA